MFTNINSNTFNICNNIVEYPFIDNLNENLTQLLNQKNIYLIIYKISNFKNLNYITYYLNDKMKLPVISLNNLHIYTLEQKINDLLISIKGIKRVKGTFSYLNTNYLVIQIRNNNEYLNWLTYNDIVVNKHYFDLTIDSNIIDLFKYNSKIGNLILNKELCIKPLSFYSKVDEKYLNYITKYNSMQYCVNMNEDLNISLIEVGKYEPSFNVRVLCFINDIDIYNSNLKIDDYIFDLNKEKWIFKNENKILILTK